MIIFNNSSLEKELIVIINDCLSGNRKAQEQLYRQLYGFAMAIAIRYSRDEPDAADIMSHAFVKMFRSLGSFDRSKGNLHGWVKQIIIHEALDHIKQRSRFSNKQLEEAEEPVIDNSAIEKMDADDLMKLIKELPPATHAVFVLYAVDGYTHVQIAKKLNISSGTSKWHLSEARKLLQQKLATKQQ